MPRGAPEHTCTLKSLMFIYKYSHTKVGAKSGAKYSLFGSGPILCFANVRPYAHEHATWALGTGQGRAIPHCIPTVTLTSTPSHDHFVVLWQTAFKLNAPPSSCLCSCGVWRGCPALATGCQQALALGIHSPLSLAVTFRSGTRLL